MKHVHDLAQAIMALPVNELAHLVDLIVDEREAELDRQKSLDYAILRTEDYSHGMATVAVASNTYDTRLDGIADTMKGLLEAHS